LDANRLSQGQLIAAVSALLLFVISFLPWFGVSGGVVTPGGVAAGSEDFNLWEVENPLDIYLLIVILVALVPGVLTFAGGGARDAGIASTATFLLGGIGTLLIIYQLFDHDFAGIDYSTKVGFWLGLIACAGIAVGGYLAMQEDMRRERY
jgi:hypothetical protein